MDNNKQLNDIDFDDYEKTERICINVLRLMKKELKEESKKRGLSLSDIVKLILGMWLQSDRHIKILDDKSDIADELSRHGIT